MITPEQLGAIVPRSPTERRAVLAAYLSAAMAEADCTTVTRAAAFLAQVAFETGFFALFEEGADGLSYEGRRDLGNTEPGDGPRYKGRGFIQITGRRNYRRAGEALGLPLEAQPELAAGLDVGARVAAWYWTDRKLNELVDERDFRGVTEAINGLATENAPSWHVRREAIYRSGLEVLGLTAPLSV